MQFSISAGQRPLYDTYVYRLEVINEGRSQARQCEVLLEELAPADAAGQYVVLPTFNPVSLNWSGSDREFVDINPGRRFFCDLFVVLHPDGQKFVGAFGVCDDLDRSREADCGVVLATKARYFVQPNRLPPGRYRLHVAAHSENTRPVTVTLSLDWSGVWRDEEEAMFKECVLRVPT